MKKLDKLNRHKDQLNGLGLVANGVRDIADASRYKKFYTTPSFKDDVVKRKGRAEDTVAFIKKLIPQWEHQTRAISPTFAVNGDLRATCFEMWKYYFNHFQYKPDQEGIEQVRSPRRSFYERQTGVDCDCFTMSLLCNLKNLQIPSYAAIIKRNGSANWSHIYVLIPLRKDGIITNQSGRNEYLVIDPVLHHFDIEADSITDKKLFNMSTESPIETLDGLPIHTLDGVQSYGTIDKQYFELTKNLALANPELISSVYSEPDDFFQLLDYAIYNWSDNNQKNLVLLENLEALEEVATKKSETLDGLSLKQFFSNTKKDIKNAVDATGEALKKAGQVVARVNPGSTLLREGMKAGMRANFAKIPSRVWIAYYPLEDVLKAGYSETDYWKARKVLKKINDIFINKLKGDREAIKRAILNPLKITKDSNRQLGDGGASAAAIAAASTLLTSIAVFMRDSGLGDLVRNKNKQNTQPPPAPTLPDFPNDFPIINPNNNAQNRLPNDHQKDSTGNTLLYVGGGLSAIFLGVKLYRTITN